ncbi:unnamed protein product [Ambrosiozyma monospora]|uniref:Unnamed protein product n=1 Tax=Ambrosiozyma monospora TaxID=43982 RepID=A0ACB5SZP1_AMBMO|nr:unnamed protein product [Ambrosiozyma monospora]
MAETPQTWAKNKKTGKNKGKVNQKKEVEEKTSSRHKKRVQQSHEQRNTNELINIDPETILNRQIDTASWSAFIRVTITHHSLRNLYKQDVLEKTIHMRDLIEPEQLITLKVNQCFTLPDEATCRRYIDLYFEHLETTHPVLSRLQFDKEFTDMRNPPSLLLLWSIFYFSATIVAKTPEQKRLSRSYYQRAKILADATFECDSIYYTLSLFILSLNPPESTQSPVSFDERIRRVIKTAIGFGMNTDPQHTTYFNDNQCKMCKRLFWKIHATDRYFAICLSNSYILKESSYNVPRLKLEDFNDMEPRIAKICYQKAIFTDIMHDFMAELNRIQKETNAAYLQDKPFRHFEKEADQVCFQLKTKMTEMFKDPRDSYYGFVGFLTYYTIELYLMRVNIFRLYYTVLRCLKREQTTPGILESYEFPESQEDVESIDYFDRIIDAIHNVADIFVKCFPLFRDKMFFSQLSVFLGYQIGIFLVVFTFSDDPMKSQLMRDDIKRLYPVLKENMDIVSWGICDFAFVYFKGLIENPDFAVELMHNWIIFDNDAILLRTAYRIPKLRTYAKKAMGCFSSVLDENFEGDYKGIIFINSKTEKELLNHNSLHTIENPTSFQSSSASNLRGNTTSIPGNLSVKSPYNIAKDITTTSDSSPSVTHDPSSNVVNSSHHPSPPANVVPSINSIINHSVLPSDLPSIDLSYIQSYLSTKPIGAETEVINPRNTLPQHNGF